VAWQIRSLRRRRSRPRTWGYEGSGGRPNTLASDRPKESRPTPLSSFSITADIVEKEFRRVKPPAVHHRRVGSNSKTSRQRPRDHARLQINDEHVTGPLHNARHRNTLRWQQPRIERGSKADCSPHPSLTEGHLFARPDCRRDKPMRGAGREERLLTLSDMARLTNPT